MPLRPLRRNMRANALVAQVAGFTGWPLEYIISMPYGKLIYLYNEINYQRQVEQYRIELLLAQVVCLWVKGNHTPKEIAGPGPKPQEVTVSMAKKAEPQIVVLGDGKEYTLPVLDANIMEVVEESIDKDWATIFANGSIRQKHLKILVHAMLRLQNPNLTLDEVGTLLTVEAENNVGKILPKLM